MSDFKIVPYTTKQLEDHPDWLDTVREYSKECSLEQLAATVEKTESYRAIETSGMFNLFVMLWGDSLVGFVVVLTPVILHYGKMIAVTESLFVRKAYRYAGAGLKLVRFVQKFTKEQGSPGLLINAPSGGVLEKLLPRLGYTETNKTFLKVFHERSSSY